MARRWGVWGRRAAARAGTRPSFLAAAWRYAEPVRPEPGEQVFFHGHPSWRSMLGFHAKGAFAAVVVGAVAGIVSASSAGHVHPGWVIVAVVAVFLIALAVGGLRRAATTYTVTDRRVVIERGVLARDVQQTRLGYVQNVASRQTWRQRLLQVGSVHFDTAGGADYDFAFYGISQPRRLVGDVDRARRAFERVGSWV